MSILDEAAYRQLTGDTTVYEAGVLESALEDGQDEVGSYLRRRGLLESGEYAENLSNQGGYLYPSATPVTEVDEGYEIITSSKIQGDAGEVTYTGGWTLETAPFVIRRALADHTRAILAVRGPDGSGGDGPITDPEGNVVPVVPPFHPDEDRTADIKSYRRQPTVF